MQELEGMDFDEKKEINKRKQLILEGKVRAAAGALPGAVAPQGHPVGGRCQGWLLWGRAA